MQRDVGGRGGISRRSSGTFLGPWRKSCGRRSRRSRSSSPTRSRPGLKPIRTGPSPPIAARDFGADIAIFLEVEQFQSQSPGDLNMVHGDSKVHIQVFEMEYPKNSRDRPIKDQPKEAHNIYDGYAESTFPNRGPLPIDSGTSRNAFKHTFLKIVVKEISWHFVDRTARKTPSRIRGSRNELVRRGEARNLASPGVTLRAFFPRFGRNRQC